MSSAVVQDAAYTGTGAAATSGTHDVRERSEGDSPPSELTVQAVPAAMGPPVLRVVDLGKEYKLYSTPRARLKALVTGRATHHSHWALQGVSFDLARGQCIGVIGDNGAGKSSLLKLLAGTLQPSVGRIERVGRVTAILELGAGFHPDFSGRNNLYFGGSLIGINREEMALLEPSIVEFSELGEAMDRPVKTYSSGMSVRLAFALVTAVQPDVLIIDEALAVGDQHFQKKCLERILDFRAKGCTILFCSHSPYHIRHLCDSALWLRDGRVADYGPTEPVLAAYELHSRERHRADMQPIAALSAAAQVSGTADSPNYRLADGSIGADAEYATGGEPGVNATAESTSLRYRTIAGAPVPLGLGVEADDDAKSQATSQTPDTADSLAANAAAQPTWQADSGSSARIVAVEVRDLAPNANNRPARLMSDDLSVAITVRGRGDERPNIGFMIEQSKGVGITALATHEEGAVPQRLPDGLWRSVLTFPDLPLHSGDYVISVYLFDATGLAVYDEWYQYLHFNFLFPKPLPGLVRLPHRWE